jgi:HK97 family phage portal protein
MQIGPFTLARTKALPTLRGLSPISSSGWGWWPLIRESFTGAWQHNVEIQASTALTYSTIFACVTLIAADVGKVCLRLVQEDDNGIWTETESPAFSPVLRKPNRYQHIVKFLEQWIVSKLIHGNTYALKQRDQRGVVTALYVLDPTRVTPLVAPDGSVYYQLDRDDLSGLSATLTVPAREIIHDLMIPLYHPLIGVSPIYACGIAAAQGLSIQNNSLKFFTNGSKPGGVLTAPGAISDATALRLKAYWEANFSGENVGKVAVLGDGLSYEAMSVNANDAQLIEQLKWTAETVCSAFHVPPYMVAVGPPPPYANIEPLVQQYYSQCLQSLFINLEQSLDAGLELPKPYGTEFDPDDLIWMDSASKSKAATDGIGSGGMSPNEARERYYALGPVPGGDTPYMQQQYWPLTQLAEREIPGIPASPAEMPQVPQVTAGAADALPQAASYARALVRKSLTEGLYAA